MLFGFLEFLAKKRMLSVLSVSFKARLPEYSIRCMREGDALYEHERDFAERECIWRFAGLTFFCRGLHTAGRLCGAATFDCDEAGVQRSSTVRVSIHPTRDAGSASTGSDPAPCAAASCRCSAYAAATAACFGF
jgi:hypothetical protein